jgi:carbon monoxide dehydrogenase subunit G
VGNSFDVFAYEGEFRLPAPPPVVWRSIRQVDAFESWWSWLRELRVEGRPLTAGCVLSGLVAPPVPYRMRLRIELVRSEPPTRIDAVVSGDLAGRAQLRFDPDPDGTRARVAWTVELRQRPMRLAARLGSPLLRWGHDRVVEATVARFRSHLAELSGPPATTVTGEPGRHGPAGTASRGATSTRSTR